MPLIRVDALKGRSPEEIKALLDAVHHAVLSTFHVPQRDRYQIYHEHPASHFVVQDTGLGIERSSKVVVITVFSKQRSREAKLALYAALCSELEKSCAIPPADVVASVFSNADEDWSFGLGRAQFLTGELK
jgi:phenylpyruvate tautomerase PptA (4-oxalocrotonate tautomerase family)